MSASGLLERIEPTDRFGVVFLLILATLLASAAGPADPLWVGLLVALEGATLVAALTASGVRRWLILAAAGVALVGVLGVVGSALSSVPSELYDPGSGLLLVLLAGLAPVAIIMRLARHSTVDGSTLLGALCVYLLAGLFFSAIYVLIDSLTSAAAFTGALNGTRMDATYFSFVTMTTLGYGDITPTTDLVRAIAIVQALIGQIYLITVVALLVGRLTIPSRDKPTT